MPVNQKRRNRRSRVTKRSFTRVRNRASPPWMDSMEAKRPQPTQPRGPNAQTALLLSTPLFPASTRRRLFYHEHDLGFTVTSGVPSGYVFSANGMFDPNITGTGHQPLGFDQMMLLYEQYTVVASKITVNLLNSNTTALSRGCIYLSPDATILSDPNRAMENGQITSVILFPNVTFLSCKSMNLDCNVPMYFGRSTNPRTIVNDPELFGTAAANPTEQVYFVISAWDPFGANTLGYFFDVTIEYDAIFWEPRKLTES